MVSVKRRLDALQALLKIRVGPGAAILPKHVTRLHLDFALAQDARQRGAKKFWRTMMPRLKYHNPTVPMSVSQQSNDLKSSKGIPAFLNIHINKSLAPSGLEPESKHFIFSRTKDIVPADIKQHDSPSATTSSESPPSTIASDSTTSESSSVTPIQSPTPNSTFQAIKPAILNDPTIIFRTTKSSPGPAPNERIVQISVWSKNAEDIWADVLNITNATQLEPTEGELQAMKEVEERKRATQIKSEESSPLREAIKQAQAGYGTSSMEQRA